MQKREQYVTLDKNFGKVRTRKQNFIPISTGKGRYNVPQGHIFVDNSWTANDFKLQVCKF